MATVRKVIRYRGAIYKLAAGKLFPVEFSRGEVGFLIQLHGGKLKEILRHAVYDNKLTDAEVSEIVSVLFRIMDRVKINPDFISRTEKLMVGKLYDGLNALLTGKAAEYPGGGGLDALVPVKRTETKDQPVKSVDAAIYEPSKGEKDFSADDLLKAFRDLDEKDAETLISRVKSPQYSRYDLLQDFNTAIDGHGVEAIKSGESSDDDDIALYVNTGDAYTATILYDIKERTLYLTTYGDWLEAMEYEQGKEKSSDE